MIVGDLYPCLMCGRVPGGSRVGAMYMLRCGTVRPRCGRYVYGKDAKEARERWNLANRPATKKDPHAPR